MKRELGVKSAHDRYGVRREMGRVLWEESSDIECRYRIVDAGTRVVIERRSVVSTDTLGKQAWGWNQVEQVSTVVSIVLLRAFPCAVEDRVAEVAL